MLNKCNNYYLFSERSLHSKILVILSTIVKLLILFHIRCRRDKFIKETFNMTQHFLAIPSTVLPRYITFHLQEM